MARFPTNTLPTSDALDAAVSSASSAASTATTASVVAAAVAADLLGGAGRKLISGPGGTYTGTGSPAIVATVSMPAGLTPANGTKYRFAGTLLVRVADGGADDGELIAEVKFSNLILLRSGGEWTLYAPGDQIVTYGTTLGVPISNFFATLPADLPGLTDGGAGTLGIETTVVNDAVVVFELDGTIADIGTD